MYKIILSAPDGRDLSEVVSASTQEECINQLVDVVNTNKLDFKKNNLVFRTTDFCEHGYQYGHSQHSENLCKFITSSVETMTDDRGIVLLSKIDFTPLKIEDFFNFHYWHLPAHDLNYALRLTELTFSKRFYKSTYNFLFPRDISDLVEYYEFELNKTFDDFHKHRLATLKPTLESFNRYMFDYAEIEQILN